MLTVLVRLPRARRHGEKDNTAASTVGWWGDTISHAKQASQLQAATALCSHYYLVWTLHLHYLNPPPAVHSGNAPGARASGRVISDSMNTSTLSAPHLLDPPFAIALAEHATVDAVHTM